MATYTQLGTRQPIDENAELKQAMAAIAQENERLRQSMQEEPRAQQQQQGGGPFDKALQAYDIYDKYASSSGGAGASQFAGAETASGAGMQSGGAMAAEGHAGTGVAQTSGAGGSSGLATTGWIAAAIVAQHQMSNETDTTIMTEGGEIETDDAFAGHYGTEPWLAFAADKLGTTPTRGEEFDAEVAGGDDDSALKAAPGMVSYWADPSSEWIEKGVEAITGDDKYSDFVNPVGWLADMFKD